MSKKILRARPKSRQPDTAHRSVEAATSVAVHAESERRAMIAEAAYYRAQQRGFAAGGEMDDWLAAEAEVTACTLLRDLQPETH